MQANQLISQVNALTITDFFNKLKQIYRAEEVSVEKKEKIVNLVSKYGYLPYSHIKALEELSDGETIIGLEEKFRQGNVYNNGSFEFNNISSVKRAGFQDASWVKKEQHSIKLINLAALGNGNSDSTPAKFIDWLKQLLILPSGNLGKGVLPTTMYVIPFHPREFGCAYLPTSSEISPALEDKLITENLGISAKQQIQLYLSLVQLAGHPTMYDVLPQTGRFSKTILSNPYLARWFNIKELVASLKQEIETLDVQAEIKELIAQRIEGQYNPIPEELKEAYEEAELLLDIKRAEFSRKMLKRSNQLNLHQKAREIINNKAEREVQFEEDISNQGEIIGELISQGMWPSPGGAWCSSGIPIFDKMSEGAHYPMFRHFDHEENDVTHFANLDCQTPYYFVNLENGTYNEEVIAFYTNFLKNLQRDYNFDAFRVDHIDHIVDAFSESEDLIPISYRAPRAVLGQANTEMKKEIPHFATLAEYMLWDDFLKEYHDDMDFDLLWGSDIVSQNQKIPSQIIDDNEKLEEYNLTLKTGQQQLSILKTYNNQDGEFAAINQYPGQLSEAGALFKWFKFKFLPGGDKSSRPVLYIDGDESFTKTGVEYCIGHEESMKRSRDDAFYEKFDAISRFAMHSEVLLSGKAKIVEHNEETGFVSWLVTSEKSQEALFVIANQQAPTEMFNEDGVFVEKAGEAIVDVNVEIPQNIKLLGEYDIFNNQFFHKDIPLLHFERLKPSEFHVFTAQIL